MTEDQMIAVIKSFVVGNTVQEYDDNKKRWVNIDYSFRRVVGIVNDIMMGKKIRIKPVLDRRRYAFFRIRKEFLK